MPHKRAKLPRKRRRLTQPSANRRNVPMARPNYRRLIMDRIEMRLLPPKEERRYHPISTLVHLEETGALGTLHRLHHLDSKKLLIDVDSINDQEGSTFSQFEEETNRTPVTSLLYHTPTDRTTTTLPAEVELAELQEPYAPHSCPPQMIMDYHQFSALLSQMTLKGSTRF